MLDVGVVVASDFHHQLVERIVIVAPYPDGPPAVAAFHFAADAHGLCEATEFLALVLVFHLQQLPLPRQGQYGVVDTHD